MVHIRLFSLLLFLFFFARPSTVYGTHSYDRWNPNAVEKESDEYLILAKVERVEDNERLNPGGQTVPPSEVKYTATVYREIRGRIADNATVTIVGHRPPQGHSANANEIPLMRPGAVFVMAVQKSKDPDGFVYDGDEILPIGIKSPKVVDEKDREHIQRSFGLLAESTRQHDAAAQRDKALSLLRDPDYYAWSLGAYMLTVDGTATDLRALLACYFEDKLTIRQLLWLNYVLGDIMPKDVAPSTAELHRLLVDYLWKRQ